MAGHFISRDQICLNNNNKQSKIDNETSRFGMKTYEFMLCSNIKCQMGVHVCGISAKSALRDLFHVKVTLMVPVLHVRKHQKHGAPPECVRGILSNIQ